jgi:uncharacterized membrane protein
MSSHLLVGILLGVTSFALIMWFAAKMERDQPGPDGAKIAQMLRIVAYADLILIPVLMNYFGASASR